MSAGSDGALWSAVESGTWASVEQSNTWDRLPDQTVPAGAVRPGGCYGTGGVPSVSQRLSRQIRVGTQRHTGRFSFHRFVGWRRVAAQRRRSVVRRHPGRAGVVGCRCGRPDEHLACRAREDRRAPDWRTAAGPDSRAVPHRQRCGGRPRGVGERRVLRHLRRGPGWVVADCCGRGRGRCGADVGGCLRRRRLPVVPRRRRGCVVARRAEGRHFLPVGAATGTWGGGGTARKPSTGASATLRWCLEGSPLPRWPLSRRHCRRRLPTWLRVRSSTTGRPPTCSPGATSKGWGLFNGAYVDIGGELVVPPGATAVSPFVPVVPGRYFHWVAEWFTDEVSPRPRSSLKAASCRLMPTLTPPRLKVSASDRGAATATPNRCRSTCGRTGSAGPWGRSCRLRRSCRSASRATGARTRAVCGCGAQCCRP